MTAGWPFDPEAATISGGYHAGFFGEWPIAQDPIAWAMSVPCDADCDDLHGPSPVYDDTLGRQLDALACDYVYTYPSQHPERVEWLEDAHYHDTASSDWQEQPDGSFAGTFEVARLVSPSGGILTVQTIDTYLRTPDFLVTGVRSDVAGLSITEPFPFPIQPADAALTWRWHLVHEWVAEDGNAPRWEQNSPERQAVPATFPLRSPWEDNRYGWGGRVAERKQYTVGGAGLVRLFVTLISTAETGFPTVRVGGQLRGFTQQAGRDAAAVRNTTYRL